MGKAIEPALKTTSSKGILVSTKHFKTGTALTYQYLHPMPYIVLLSVLMLYFDGKVMSLTVLERWSSSQIAAISIRSLSHQSC